ncbi:DUF3221 domain-containing protein [Cohnella luojiensis]|uniref:DUF3221 domain-containing protein n=1 Tax=Cohnella luojiensis TaxID=652876 RepID=A0A4Y8LNT8_9BACL|nr:DUF3221 domain-containing protein [Cohnella luojiensis]TFE22669.1 DUF3221 domain-containing protein [Cohnella luojiensis]
MRKNILLTIMIGLLILALTACGNKPNDNPAGPGTDSSVQDPDMKGTITAIDGNRVLIVDKLPNAPDDSNPMAIWVDFPAEAVADVKVGYKVKAWSLDGVMLESYPMQTKGSRLEIVSADIGTGDLQGTITEVRLDENDVTKSYVVIDGNEYGLLPITVYWRGDSPVDISVLKIGVQVEAWFPGYQVMNEKQITQLRIVD